MHIRVDSDTYQSGLRSRLVALDEKKCHIYTFHIVFTKQKKETKMHSKDSLEKQKLSAEIVIGIILLTSAIGAYLVLL